MSPTLQGCSGHRSDSHCLDTLHVWQGGREGGFRGYSFLLQLWGVWRQVSIRRRHPRFGSAGLEQERMADVPCSAKFTWSRGRAKLSVLMAVVSCREDGWEAVNAKHVETVPTWLS